MDPQANMLPYEPSSPVIVDECLKKGCEGVNMCRCVREEEKHQGKGSESVVYFDQRTGALHAIRWSK